MDTKSCNKCKIEKDLDEFYADKTRAHLDGRRTICIECERSAYRDWYSRNKDKNAEYTASWRKRNPDKQKILQQKCKDELVYRKSWLKTRYNLSLETYQEKFDAQHGKCAICKRAQINKWLAVDHDRACCPGKKSCGNCIRDLLCTACNQGIGLFREDIEFLKNAISYLEIHNG